MNEEISDVLSCTEKMSFDTKEQAQASVLTASWQRGAKLRVYQCKQCRLWHMTSNH